MCMRGGVPSGGGRIVWDWEQVSVIMGGLDWEVGATPSRYQCLH